VLDPHYNSFYDTESFGIDMERTRNYVNVTPCMVVLETSVSVAKCCARNLSN